MFPNDCAISYLVLPIDKGKNIKNYEEKIEALKENINKNTTEMVSQIEDQMRNKIQYLESTMDLRKAETDSKIANLKENINKNMTEMVGHIEDQMKRTSKVETLVNMNFCMNLLLGNDASQGEKLFKLLRFN